MDVRPLVNGALLSQHIGQTVTIFGTVLSTDRNGSSFELMSTDRLVITVSLRNALSEPLTGVVEVHGIVKGKTNIICNYYMAFPNELSNNFDNDIVNDTVTLIHSVPCAWKAPA